MLKAFIIFIIGGLVLLLMGSLFFLPKKDTITPHKSLQPTSKPANLDTLSIEAMRQRSYPGSDILIEEKLNNGTNYDQYIVSYKSDGLKIYGLLTVPQGEKPASGWPAIIFNHGYIAPATYQTAPDVGQYASYLPIFARSGYIVFKPDYRGNGNSEGLPEGAYYSPAYTVDDLNAIASIKKFKDANPNKIGIWGHSMGGNIALRDLVIHPQGIKVAVIWGGVVGSYNDLIHNWQRRVPFRPGPTEMALRNSSRQKLINRYGDPQTNPYYWNTIDPTHFISDITAPIQLHHSVTDEEVPVDFSRSLYDELKKDQKQVELYTYEGDNHNISANFELAMQRSLAFFDKYLK